MAYPSSIDTFAPRTDNVDDVLANDINIVYTAVTNTQTELGTDVAGAAVDLKTRLAKTINDDGYLELAPTSALTISSGVITITQNYHRVDTEGSATTDDLDTINGFSSGYILLIRPVNPNRDIVIKHNTGNILCSDGQDINLTETYHICMLIYDNLKVSWIAQRWAGGSSITGLGPTQVSGSIYPLALFSGLTSLTSGGISYNTDTTANGGGQLTMGGQALINYSDTATDTSGVVLYLNRNADTTDAAANGIGAELRFRVEDSTAANRNAGAIVTEWEDATAATRVADMVFRVYNSSGVVERMRLTADTDGVIFNEDGDAADFRVEGNTATELFYIDGTAEIVTFGDYTGGNYAQFDTGGNLSFSGGATLDAKPNRTIATKDTSYTTVAADDVILCNAAAGAFTVTLVAASGNTGLQYDIKKTDTSANVVTVDPNAAETIDGAADVELQNQYDAVSIVCDGSNWLVI